MVMAMVVVVVLMVVLMVLVGHLLCERAAPRCSLVAPIRTRDFRCCR